VSFKKFLTNMQAMFTGLKDNDEILTDAEKISLLFQKVQSPGLTQVKNAFKGSYDLDTGGQDVSFDFIANSMSAEAASLPEHVPTVKRVALVVAKAATAQRQRAESRGLTV
jgi:4-hydroxyphenylpyruvate dioxygenase-like putative hemolysin